MAADFQLQELLDAAEVTIAAAAAALGWAGEDDSGVLEHVAAISPVVMAVSRYGYEMDQRYAPHRLHEKSDRLEMAALPATAAPTWALAVDQASAAAAAEAHSPDLPPWLVLSPARSSLLQPRPSGLLTERVGPADDVCRRLRADCAFLRYLALRVCAMWGDDPLPLNDIRDLANDVAWSSGPRLEVDLQL